MLKHDQLKSLDIDPAQFFERMLSQVEDYISVWNRKKQFIYVNQRLEDLWPFSPQEYFGKTPTDLGFSREGTALFESNIAKVIEAEESVYGTFPYTPPFGTLRDYDFCFSPVFDDAGRVEFVIGFTRDVTDLKEARKELDRIRKD